MTRTHKHVWEPIPCNLTGTFMDRCRCGWTRTIFYDQDGSQTVAVEPPEEEEET